MCINRVAPPSFIRPEHFDRPIPKCAGNHLPGKVKEPTMEPELSPVAMSIRRYTITEADESK
jgi:hypothetical protein